MKRARLRARPHGMSRFAAVTEAVIDACQSGIASGIPGLGPAVIAVIAEESRETDRLLARPARELLVLDLGGLSDWSLAVIADLCAGAASRYLAKLDDLRARTLEGLGILAGKAELARLGGIVDEELTAAADSLRRRELEALTRVIDSPTASPMLWYQAIFAELDDEERRRKGGRTEDLKLRYLAHDVRLCRGANARVLLRELGEIWARAGEGDRNLRLLAGLLEDDTADLWTYNWIAVAGDSLGVPSLTRAAARQGLLLIEERGDPEKLEQQLRRTLSEDPPGREDDAASRCPEAYEALRAALGRGFEGGSHHSELELCRALVPGFDTVPVKQPREAHPSRPSVRRSRSRRERRRRR